jgi:hypothetical protein
MFGQLLAIAINPLQFSFPQFVGGLTNNSERLFFPAKHSLDLLMHRAFVGSAVWSVALLGS